MQWLTQQPLRHIKTDISVEIAHTECILKDNLSTKQHKRYKRLIFICFLLQHTQPHLPLFQATFSSLKVMLQSILCFSSPNKHLHVQRKDKCSCRSGNELVLFNLLSLTHPGLIKEEDLSHSKGPCEEFQPSQKRIRPFIMEDTADYHHIQIILD